MLKIVLLYINICLPFFSLAQINNTTNSQSILKPVIKTIIHKIGDSNISIKTFQYGDKKDIVFISLHDNEFTGMVETQSLLEKQGGLLIKIENDYKRNISFRLHGRSYTFDPNRMFSKIGIQKTLVNFGRTSEKAINEINKFARHVLGLFPKDLYCAIALHDNTEGGYSVKYYQAGSQYEKDAKLVTVDPSQDADDFFLTTDSVLFQQLSAKNYNVILQDNKRAIQDGSLSVYFGKKNIRYLNCETEHGKTKQYEEMVRAIYSVFEEIK